MSIMLSRNKGSPFWAQRSFAATQHDNYCSFNVHVTHEPDARKGRHYISLRHVRVDIALQVACDDAH
jgi:hypothetical protein